MKPNLRILGSLGKARATGLLPILNLLFSILYFSLLHPAAAQSAAHRQTFDSFRMVHSRNIFDPDRRPMLSQSGVRVASTPPPTKSDYIALVGIMQTPAKVLAFFSGSRPDYDKVLATGDKIANASIVKITTDNAQFIRDGKQITVAVGQTLPLDNSAMPATAPAPVAAAAADQSGPPSSETSTPAKDDLIRRMMEKRNQDLK